MRQCLTRRAYPRKAGWHVNLSRWERRYGRNFSISNGLRLDDHASQSILHFKRKYNVFNRILIPGQASQRDPAAWTSLLEPGLPPHLRENGKTETSTNLDASDIAEIILAAQNETYGQTQIDVLYHLGVEQGRWRAVVWLVKHLVEAFAPAHLKSLRLTKTLCTWTDVASLHQITNNAINVQASNAPKKDAAITSLDLASLDELTDDLRPEKLSREAILRHDTLGSIWRSIGLMTINCAGVEIQPEILEIIAYLHHMEIMPSSIYNQKPSSDPTAIQQPLMLTLFSSRILTSLSDAAWRAHAQSVIEEVKLNGTERSPLRPEIPGMAYRVHVAGLRPEVWLELILWSCLHGGWILQGTAILRAAYDVPAESDTTRKWRPLSWRSLMDYSEHDQDWDKFEFMFNTETFSATSGAQTGVQTSVRRTVSTEVVNAYVDALLSTISQGVGQRGVAQGTVLRRLQMLHKFLGRSDSKLETGSWDAVVLRFVDTVNFVINQRENFDRLVSLSPSVGEELQSNDSRALPAYVLDGSAAVLGLFHHALRSRVKAGDIHGALRLFESLQTLADKNKHQSVIDFLRKQQLLADGGYETTDAMFTNNFSGIEYPAFHVQVPVTILGPFLELVADAKAYDFGRWLLYSDEIDGPVLPEEYYGNAAVAPALVRFASETQDTTLLSKVIKARSLQPQPGEPTMPRNVLQSFFESQVNLHRWDSAIRILEHMRDNHSYYWNVINVAHVIRVMLWQIRGSAMGDERAAHNLSKAQDLLRDMVLGKYDRLGERMRHVQEQITLLLTMLATLDRSWAEFALNMQPLMGAYVFNLPPKACNLVMEGIVDAYGSVAGRRLLGIFLSHHILSEQNMVHTQSLEEPEEPKMTRYIPSVLDKPERRRTAVRIPGQPQEEVVVYGGLKPDLMTIQIIFNKATNELKNEARHIDDASEPQLQPPPSDLLPDDGTNDGFESSASGMVDWAIRCFRLLDMANEDIRDELLKALPESQLKAIKAKFPALFNGPADVQVGSEDHLVLDRPAEA